MAFFDLGLCIALASIWHTYSFSFTHALSRLSYQLYRPHSHEQLQVTMLNEPLGAELKAFEAVT